MGIDKIPPFGPLPVTVPGAVAGWTALHKRFGKKSFDELFTMLFIMQIMGSHN